MGKLESGQALTEYIILLAIVISLYTALLNKLSQTNAMAAMKKPFTQDFKYVYQYGNVKARGQSDGGPIYIPQYSDETQNFRIFINPPIKQ